MKFEQEYGAWQSKPTQTNEEPEQDGVIGDTVVLPNVDVAAAVTPAATARLRRRVRRFVNASERCSAF